MVTKKIRTEYMKKFKDPKWETFSKCYEDSLKYRIARRVMEHSHKPWFGEGWDGGSDSSGRSTPRMKNKVVPLTVKPSSAAAAAAAAVKYERESSELKAALELEPPFEIENGLKESDLESVRKSSGLSDDTATEDGPVERESTDEEPAKPEPRCCHRHRAARSEPGHRDSSDDNQPAPRRKPPRAKSQPPVITKETENRRPSSRLNWTERHAEPTARRTPSQSHTSDACVQTRRESDKMSANLERRRARSADVEKMRTSGLTVVDDRWMTEYMRCFSARLR
ncbi:centriole, cilia and spindle-associated protein [Aplochiton taeniatus]